MDTLRSDRGQALVVAAALAGLAAFAVVGVLTASDQLVDRARDERAGEAAAAAAAAAVADLLFERTRGRATPGEIEVFARDAAVVAAASEAAARIARLHGRADPSEVTLHAFGLELEVHVVLAGRAHIALLEPAP